MTNYLRITITFIQQKGAEKHSKLERVQHLNIIFQTTGDQREFHFAGLAFLFGVRINVRDSEVKNINRVNVMDTFLN